MTDQGNIKPILSSVDLLPGTRKPRLVTQFLASFIACLAAMSMGLTLGYSSPALADMKKPHRRLHLTMSEEGWVSSILAIGALIGGLIAGSVVDYFGRKLSFLITSVPFTIGWLFIVYADSVGLLCLGRIVTGVCVGITCLNTSVFITEIASPQIRGIVGSWFQLFVNLGILIAYTVGSFETWTKLAVLSAVLPIISMILMSFMHESPVWLLRQGNIEGARQSLQFYRGDKYDIECEIDDLRREKQNEEKMSLKEIRNPVILKPLLIIEAEMILQQFCGINAVVFNVAKIFQNAKMGISANEQGIIVGCVMVIASILCSGLMDKAGRRILLLIGAIVMTISLISLGTFYYLYDHQREVADRLTWLPVTCLVVFVFIFNIGFGPIPWLSMSELFPAKARSFASSVATATNWTFAFVITKTFLDLESAITSYGVFWFYAFFSFLAIFFIWFFVPETKGKSPEEIQRYFT